MEDYKQIILNAEPGQIIPIVKQIDIDNPMDFFAKISDYGRSPNCCLFESKEYLAASAPQGRHYTLPEPPMIFP